MNRISNSFFAYQVSAERYALQPPNEICASLGNSFHYSHIYALMRLQNRTCKSNRIRVKISNKTFKDAIRLVIVSIVPGTLVYSDGAINGNGRWYTLPCGKYLNLLSRRKLRMGNVIYLSIDNA